MVAVQRQKEVTAGISLVSGANGNKYIAIIICVQTKFLHTRLIVTIGFLGFVVLHQRRAQLHEIVAQLDEPVGIRSGGAVDLAGNIADGVL